MEMIVFMLALLAITLLVGGILGWVAIFKTRALRKEIHEIQDALNQLRIPQSTASPTQFTTPASAAGPVAADPVAPAAPSASAKVEAPSDKFPELDESGWIKEEVEDREPNPLIENLRHHWMIWLGGICVGLAGVFMVKYSIERGLLGPGARVAISILTGLGLHAAAEWLRRTKGAHPSFAALAGGASLILYSALLAAMQLYQLISPGTAFALLAIVSLLTMLLSLNHGPMLAMLGLLGSYILPLLVSTGSSNIVGAMIYALIISASGLLLIRYIYRPWLWIGILFGALGWWTLSFFTSVDSAHGFRGPYLAVLSYLLLSVPALDFFLKTREHSKDEKLVLPAYRIGVTSDQVPLTMILFFMIVLQTLAIIAEQISPGSLVSWVPLTLLLFVVARRRDQMVWLPWAALALQMIAWLVVAADNNGIRHWPLKLGAEDQNLFIQYAAWTAFLHSALSAWNLRQGRYVTIWASMMLLSPLLWLALSYSLTDHVAFSWQWAAWTVVLGLLYGAFAATRLTKGNANGLTIWMILGAHFAYALAATIMLSEAGLTLILATQVVSLAWVIHRYRLQGMEWLLKAVIAVIVIRLTVNPWLLDYPISTHWTLWTYGGATLCCALAAWRLYDHPRLGKWLELATLHLLVLTIWAELRYWLYGGNVFAGQYGFTEAAINTSLWIALAIVYKWRSKVSAHLHQIFSAASYVLLVMALVNYALSLTVLNPLWTNYQVGSTPVFNILLLAYGLPILMFITARLTFPELNQRLMLALIAIAAFVFINIEIHHIWNAGLSRYNVISDGELYTYSVVWLMLAVAVLLAGQYRGDTSVYRAGIGLLGLVIAKIFLVDMSGLEGLLRVASFMGLGLGLLGVAYLLQRFNGLADATPDNNEIPD